MTPTEHVLRVLRVPACPAMQRLLGIWALASLGASVSEASVSEVSLRDLHRAKTKKPRDAFRGSSQAEMSKTLNEHLRPGGGVAPAWQDAQS